MVGILVGKVTYPSNALIDNKRSSYFCWQKFFCQQFSTNTPCFSRMNDIDMQHVTSYGFSLFLLDLVIFPPSPFSLVTMQRESLRKSGSCVRPSSWWRWWCEEEFCDIYEDPDFTYYNWWWWCNHAKNWLGDFCARLLWGIISCVLVKFWFFF